MTSLPHTARTRTLTHRRADTRFPAKFRGDERQCGVVLTRCGGVQGQHIIDQIEASARSWEQIEKLVGMSKQHILEVVSQLFKRCDQQRRGKLSWKSFAAAVLILTGKHFSVRPPRNLCPAHAMSMVSPSVVCRRLLISPSSLLDRSLLDWSHGW